MLAAHHLSARTKKRGKQAGGRWRTRLMTIQRESEHARESKGKARIRRNTGEGT